MAYKQMLEFLQKSFDDNVQKIRRKQVLGDAGEQLTLPTLSGLSGIGKTACIEEFSAQKGFALIKFDCSYETSNFVLIHLNNAINSIAGKKSKGLVLLLDYINEADEELMEIINQYRKNYLDGSMKVAKVSDDGEPLSPIEYRNIDVSYDSLPETIFIVGEQRA